MSNLSTPNDHTPAAGAPVEPRSACCAATASFVRHLGGVRHCPECGERYEGAAPAQRPANDDDAPSEVRSVSPVAGLPALADALGELALATQWEDAERARYGCTVGAVRNPLVRLQGDADGAERDASARDVGALWQRFTTPRGKKDEEMRERLYVRLVSAAAPASLDELDFATARFHARRLASLPGHFAAGLRALGRYCSVTSSWADAARVLADAVAPPELRQAWELTVAAPEARRPGRPRRDVTEPPPAAERVEYGAELLPAYLRAWARAEPLPDRAP